jgi:uncharacterized protein YoxC
MFEWVKDALVAGLAALFGGVLSSLFGYGYLSRLHKKSDDNKKEIKRLYDENITKLENKVDTHISDDKSQAILTEIKNLGTSFSTLEKDVKVHIKEDKSQQVLTEVENLGGSLDKVSDKVDAWGNKTAEQGAEIKANANYIGNTYKSIQDHKREKH